MQYKQYCLLRQRPFVDSDRFLDVDLVWVIGFIGAKIAKSAENYRLYKEHSLS